MRRFLVICCALLALAVPAGALAARDGDGTIAVRNAAGDPGQVVVWLNVSGAVIGQIDAGRVIVEDLSLSGDAAPVVTGYDKEPRDLPSGATVYAGSDVRFRAVGGHYWIRVIGHGIDVNVVGQGQAKLAGTAGRYSVNGGSWLSIPFIGDVFHVGS